MDDMKFENLTGKTIAAISGLAPGSENVDFETSDGQRFTMYHSQSCCEHVSVEDVCGDVADLIGSPVTLAEEVTSNQNPPDAKKETIEYQDSFTWTFYKLATVKGGVTIRWYGSSNGYYGEGVSFARAET